MKWFDRVRRKNVRQAGDDLGRTDKVSFQIAGKILSTQRKLADFLNAKTSGISSRGMLALLICFVAMFGAYCLYLVCGAVANWF